MSLAYAPQARSADSVASGHKFDQQLRACRHLSGRCAVAHMQQACRYGKTLHPDSEAKRLHSCQRVARTSHSGTAISRTTTAFQSQTPIEHSREVKPPSSGPKFKPFTPQVTCRFCSVIWQRYMHKSLCKRSATSRLLTCRPVCGKICSTIDARQGMHHVQACHQGCKREYGSLSTVCCADPS